MTSKGKSMLLKKTLLFILILACVSALWAGDSASFVDLGFSQDGKTYMFGQYGVKSPSLTPWAELFVVDVRSNNFVPKGKFSHTQPSPIKAGQDGSGVLYKLLSGNTAVPNSYGINFQNQGLPLYISRDENPPENGETIEFRDFLSGKSYTAQLIPTVFRNGTIISSSFYINLECRLPGGQVKTYTVGTPQVKRAQISTYNMKRVIIDASGESIIFVIEMKRVAENSHDVRYMVEALRL